MKKLLLFDIDGTLVRGFHSHLKAFTFALKYVHHIDVAIDDCSTNGLTDRIILKTILDECEIHNYRLPECFKAMKWYFKKTLPQSEMHVIPGVLELLHILSLDPDVIIGHVTGNIQSIAYAKMRRMRLNPYFSCGGYGCAEHDERYELISIAIRDAWRLFGFVQTENNVFLFGDTPRDMEAGQKAQVTTIGVATGKHYTQDDLLKASPSVVISDYIEGQREVLQTIYNT